MPPFVTVWGIAECNKRNHRVDWRATIIDGEQPAEMMRRQILLDTGCEPTFIERIDLDRRTPPKDVCSPHFLLYHV
jgi:hypothetical protein